MDHSKQIVSVTALRDVVMHEVAMPVRWGDMDAYQHVNNTVYFRYMGSAVWNGLPAWLRDGGR